MRNNTMLLLSVSLFTACTDAPAPTSDTTADGSLANIVNGLRPVSAHQPQPVAVATCAVNTHLPTAVNVQEALGDCVATSRGWLCAPLSIRANETAFGDLELAQVWTSTSCELPAQQSGFFVASFETGEIQCVSATLAAARPLCVR